MNITILASGSKGNVAYIETTNKKLIIDVGLSKKKTNELLNETNFIDLNDIDLILITHAHIDHVNGFIPIYNMYQDIKFITSEKIKGEMEEKLKRKFLNDRFIFIDGYSKGKDIDIFAFKLNHDVTCQGYMIVDKHTNESYVHIADNGKLFDKDTVEMLHNKTFYAIESNHDRTLQVLDKIRHVGLKRRVLGYYGHTNNVDAIELTFKLVGDNTKSVVFTHLSEECNKPTLAKEIHENMIAIWGHKSLFKNIRMLYALQDIPVEL